MNDGLVICQYLKENGFDAYGIGQDGWGVFSGYSDEEVVEVHIKIRVERDGIRIQNDIQIWPGEFVEYPKREGKGVLPLPRLESPNYIEELKEFVATLTTHWHGMLGTYVIK